MTLEKLCQHIDKSCRAAGLGSPKFEDMKRVLIGLSLLVDQVADPDCIFTDKLNVVLADVANDRRQE